jgi:hypothetical protein
MTTKRKKQPGDVRAMHRNGQQGTMEKPDANGFALFHSDTGTRYTVHSTEVTHDGMGAKQRRDRLELWVTWPDGTLRFKVERPDGAAPAFIVARTPRPLEVRS